MATDNHQVDHFIMLSCVAIYQMTTEKKPKKKKLRYSLGFYVSTLFALDSHYITQNIKKKRKKNDI
jgi:hypothetical protein